MNDVTIFYGICIFFVLIGVITPYINSEWDLGETENNPDLDKDISEDKLPSIVSLGDIVGSMFKMFLWSFGALPVFIELIIFVPLRMILVFIVIRWIRGS